MWHAQLRCSRRSASPASLPSRPHSRPALPGGTLPGVAKRRTSRRRSAAQARSAQRGASAVAAVVYVGATLLVLARAGIWRAHPNAIVFRWGTWLLAVVMLLGAVPNFASQSRWEIVVFGPLALVLSGLCFLVARRAMPGRDER